MGAGDIVPETAAGRQLTDDERARLEDALPQAMNELPDEDRVITRMRFWNAISVADIARLLRIDQKPLFGASRPFKSGCESGWRNAA